MTRRIGLIVPSSNTTMETELPELFRRRAALPDGGDFTWHSARARMAHVTPDELNVARDSPMLTDWLLAPLAQQHNLPAVQGDG